MNFIKNSNQVLDERAKKERKNKTGNKQSDYLAPKEPTNSKNSSIKNIIGDVIHSYKVFKNWNFNFIMLVYVPSKHLVFSSCHMHYIRHSRTTNQLRLLPLFPNRLNQLQRISFSEYGITQEIPNNLLNLSLENMIDDCYCYLL